MVGSQPGGFASSDHSQTQGACRRHPATPDVAYLREPQVQGVTGRAVGRRPGRRWKRRERELGWAADCQPLVSLSFGLQDLAAGWPRTAGHDLEGRLGGSPSVTPQSRWQEGPRVSRRPEMAQTRDSMDVFQS